MRRIGPLAAGGLLTALAAGVVLMSRLPPAIADTAAEAGSETVGEPVEPDMHEFMEYVFQPTFLRLKSQMASGAPDNQAWKAIKADSLILAEGGNLLLIRKADEDASDWMRHSTEMRGLGGQLYRAAKSKDLTAARQHYGSMVTKCNACHTQFAGGEHQLKP